MASTMKVTFAAGAELGMRCLTNIEYGNCLSRGGEPSSCTRVKGMALKWGARNPTPKSAKNGKQSSNFSVYGRRTFNNLRTNFAVEIPKVAIRDGNVITEEYLGVMNQSN